MAVTRQVSHSHHWSPVITVVPVVMPTGVASVVGPVPAAGKIVAVVLVAVVVRRPCATIRNDAPTYRYVVATEKSLGPAACGLIVLVVAVESAVPCVVCQGAPQLRSCPYPAGI